jgi:hypothetical protein
VRFFVTATDAWIWTLRKLVNALLQSPTEIKYTVGRKKSESFSANGNWRGDKARFHYGFLSLVGGNWRFLETGGEGGLPPLVKEHS